MFEFHPYFTNDGSVGLYSPEFKDIYHSTTGALTEAYEKFIMPVDIENLLAKDSIKVLDICYGIGYNSKSFLNLILENYFLKISQKNNKHAKQYIETICTNNNSEKNNNESVSNYSMCTETIDTHNIFDKIYIKSVDIDKNLFSFTFCKNRCKKF